VAGTVHVVVVGAVGLTRGRRPTLAMFISGRKLIAARGTQFREDGRYSENTVELPLGCAP
jgi:hypothetical protein